MYIHMLLYALHTERPFDHINLHRFSVSVHSNLLYICMSIFNLLYVGGCPSESDLSKVLDIIPEWYDLAVALGVPVERVEHFQRIKTGGIEALCYWRCGESEQNHPTSWRFLLDKIEECHGQDVVRDMKKVFSNLSG